ncbi:nucleobase:cation symporter-2, NCS2 family [Rhizobiales bacterium GAS191]|nr:nucleobase:cation symporter-2, NCS2 family [Rhizobiales bacterium GAS191]
MLSPFSARVKRLLRGSADRPAERKPARPPELLYSVDETPPRAVLVVAALQHVAVIAVTLVFPLILARDAGLSGARFLDLVSLSILALGVSTILLCIRSEFVGSGFLCPACFTGIFLGPSEFALQRGGLALVFGMTLVAGLVQIAIAQVLHRLRPLLPTEIAGVVIAIVGLSLASLGVRYSLGISGSQGIQPAFLAVSGISLATMTALNVWTRGYAKMFCVLIGLAVGYVASAAFGVLDLTVAVPREGLDVVRLPRFENIGLRFDAFALAPFVVAALASTLRVMGDVSNAQRLNDKGWVRPSFRSLAGGVVGNGLASMFCGIVGSFGVNTYSSCIGLSAATGVTSRSLGYAIGVIFIVLAFIPAAAIVFAAMPIPVMGACLFFTAAFVFTSGLQMTTARMLDARRTIVIGFSFAAAVTADIYHDAFRNVPATLQPIFDNSLVLGTVCAVLLNLIMRIGVRQRVSMQLEPRRINREAVEQFLSEQGARWAARRDIVNRAIFGVIQSLEVLGDLPDRAEIEASFDEFNLDVCIRYTGAPLVIPEQRPSPREIVASEEGERLLAGYLLRRSADRISCRKGAERAEVHLHYDH